MQYLYRDGSDYVFMDNVSYDQVQVSPDALGEASQYVKEGDSAVLQMYDEEIVGVDLPASVELTVAETEPGVQGDRVLGGPEAGHPGDGPRDPGASVRQSGRTDQGRHPHRRVHHKGLIRRLYERRCRRGPSSLRRVPVERLKALGTRHGNTPWPCSTRRR